MEFTFKVNINPAVSIIVPVYNVEKYLDRCLSSLLSQTLKNIEIILVDDGSPDRCPQLCDKYAVSHANIKVVHKQNAGLGMACNSGLEVAAGKFVAFVDSDDWVDEDMYERMFVIAEKYEADAVYSGLERNDGIKATGRLPHPSSMEIFATRSGIDSLMKDMIASEPSIEVDRRIQVSAKVVLYRKEIIDKNALRFENERQLISEDLFFNLDFLKHASKVIVIPEFFYHYFVNPSSITTNTIKDKTGSFEKLHSHIFERYDQFRDDSDFICRADRLFIGYIRSYMNLISHSKIPQKEKLKRLRKLCLCSNWKVIASRYPIASMPLKHKIILMLTLKQHVRLLLIIFNLR